MLSFLCFVIAAVVFFLAAVGAGFPRTNQAAWGLFFLALGFVLSGSGPIVGWVRSRNSKP